VEELIAHLFGDYVLQAHRMAVRKVDSATWAVIHGAFYTIPFLLLTQSVVALSVIFLTHVVIDHWRIASRLKARYERLWSGSMREFSSAPAWIAVWVTIIIDNSFHLLINHLALML